MFDFRTLYIGEDILKQVGDLLSARVTAPPFRSSAAARK
jgi:hypothetical protein